MTSREDRLFTPELTGVAVAVVLGAIMTILDATIVNVALPVLRRELDVSIAAIQWVPTIYLLAFVAVIPLTGWATHRFGAKQVWLAALTAFLAGSLLCALATSLPLLLVARVVQGLGGGIVMPVGQAMLAQVAGPRRMGRVMSVVGVPMLLAPVAGPVIGGALVGVASWRWIFVVNLPVTMIALAMALRLLPADGGRRDARVDAVGAALLPTGLAAVVYGLAGAAARGTIGGRPAVALLVGGVLVAAYVGHALRAEHPLVDVRLFAGRAFGSAAATNFVLGVALFAVALLLPLYLQLVRGATPLQTGLLLVPQGLGAALAMPVSGSLTDRVGARSVVTGGIAAAVAGLAVFTQLTATTPYAVFCLALLLVGAGLGATITPAMAAGFRDLAPAVMPQASSAIAVVQRLAGSIGSAVLASALQYRMDAAGLPATPVRLATAFGETFAIALALSALAIAPALLLPGRGFHVATGAEQSAGEESTNVRRAQPHHRVSA